jgi:hypothetical protein
VRRPSLPHPVALVALVALVLAGCATGAAEPPTADVGECLLLADLAGVPDGGQEGQVQQIPTVGCDEPHDAEVLLAYDLPEGPFPGQEVVDGVVESQCLPQFRTYVGVSYEESELLEILTVYPTQDSWAVGDREVLCIVHTADGATVTGTFEDAERSG